MNATKFLIETLFDLYLMVIMLRIWLQLTRADFYNPLSQLVVKATQPVVGPLRRFVPSIGRLDTASVLFALAVSFAKLSVVSLAVSQNWYPIPFLIFTPFDLAIQALNLMFYVLLLRAILSFVSQGSSPVEYVLMQLTEPMLRPVRSIIPPLGGFDLSVLVVIIAIQFLMILVRDFAAMLF